GQKPKIMVRPLVRVTTEKPTREHETAGPCADCHHRLYRKRKRLADLYHQNERPAVPPCQPGQPVERSRCNGWRFWEGWIPMAECMRFRRGLRARIVGEVGVPLALSLAVPWAGGQSGFAGETPVIQGHPNSVLIQGHPGHGATPAPVPVYALAECLHLALERQPAIAAQRASLGAAQNASQAVENLRIPTLIARELPYRRQQACLGGTIAATAL